MFFKAFSFKMITTKLLPSWFENMLAEIIEAFILIIQMSNLFCNMPQWARSNSTLSLNQEASFYYHFLNLMGCLVNKCRFLRRKMVIFLFKICIQWASILSEPDCDRGFIITLSQHYFKTNEYQSISVSIFRHQLSLYPLKRRKNKVV